MEIFTIFIIAAFIYSEIQSRRNEKAWKQKEEKEWEEYCAKIDKEEKQNLDSNFEDDEFYQYWDQQEKFWDNELKKIDLLEKTGSI